MRFRWVAYIAVLVILSMIIGRLLPLADASAEFKLQDMDGKIHTLEEYQGKWVLVNFWATWCPPCLEEIPDLILLYDQRKDKDFVVIGITNDFKNAEEVRQFADDNLVSYPLVLGGEQTLKQFGSIDVLPTSYLYSPSGKLVKRHHGVISLEMLEKLISGN